MVEPLEKRGLYSKRLVSFHRLMSWIASTYSFSFLIMPVMPVVTQFGRAVTQARADWQNCHDMKDKVISKGALVSSVRVQAPVPPGSFGPVTSNGGRAGGGSLLQAPVPQGVEAIE